jgi:hypothetical protein
MNNLMIRVLKSIRNTPIELVLFGLFLIILIPFYWILPKYSLNKYGLGFMSIVFYIFCLISSIQLVLGNDWIKSSKRIKSLIEGILIQLIIIVIYGLVLIGIEFIFDGKMIDIWKCILMILLSALWIVLISSSRIKRFAESFNNDGELDNKIATFFNINFFKRHEDFNSKNIVYYYWYLIGALIVIIGAFFKIMHFSFSSTLIFIGLAINVIVFIISIIKTRRIK